MPELNKNAEISRFPLLKLMHSFFSFLGWKQTIWPFLTLCQWIPFYFPWHWLFTSRYEGYTDLSIGLYQVLYTPTVAHGGKLCLHIKMSWKERGTRVWEGCFPSSFCEERIQGLYSVSEHGPCGRGAVGNTGLMCLYLLFGVSGETVHLGPISSFMPSK